MVVCWIYDKGPGVGNVLFEDMGEIHGHMMVLRHQVQRSPPGVVPGCHVGAVLLHTGPGKTHLTVPRRPVQRSLPGVVLGSQIGATLLHKKPGEIHMTAP